MAVAKYNSFTRAAEEINVSQPALSQQINKLENELGISLFARTTRSVQLTPAGKEFLTHARLILSELMHARHCIQEYAAIRKGHLSLGASMVMGYYNIPKLVSSFQDKFPGIKLSILEGECEELLNMLHTSKIDAAFVETAKPDDRFKSYKLVTDRKVLVTNHDHPLAKRLSVDLKDLKNEKLILNPAASVHHQDFCNSCRAADFVPDIVLNCSVVNTILSFVREGLGITVLLSSVAAAECGAGIKIIPITPAIYSEVAMLTRSGANLSPTLKLFLNSASQWFKTQSDLNTPMLQQLPQIS